jgi:hypothetical protein
MSRVVERPWDWGCKILWLCLFSQLFLVAEYRTRSTECARPSVPADISRQCENSHRRRHDQSSENRIEDHA